MEYMNSMLIYSIAHFVSYFYLLPAQVSLFSAARYTTALTPGTPFLMQEITAQRGQGYKLSTGYFKVPLNGTYVFHLSTGVSIGETLRLDLALGSLQPSLCRTSTSHNGSDMMSRDFMSSLTKDQSVYIYLYTGNPSSDGFRQTSFSGFLLDNLMYPKIAFCVSSNSSSSPLGKIDYSVTSINEGNAWDTKNDTFTAPRSGVYVFSLNCGANSKKNYQVFVYINNVKTHALLYGSSSQNGWDMTSRMVVVSLTAGNTVFASLDFGTLWNDGNAHSTSFAGFLYEPLDSRRKVIWSVHYSNSFLSNSVSVNIGNGWNSAANKFVVPYAGVYQLHLTATSPMYGQLNFQLLWNGVAYVSIYVTTTSHNGAETRSRAIMIEASVGDTFSIASYANLYISPERPVSFAGFLLSP